MPSKRDDHIAFLNLHKEFVGYFHGHYLQNSPPAHSKVYSWFKDGKSVIGYAGSANYSQYGFFTQQQINQVSFENADLIYQFYKNLLARSTYIPDSEIVVPSGHHIELETDVPPGMIEWEIPNTRVRISFLDRKGDLPKTSGLNWGQRAGREQNQAYLGLRQDARIEGFLPEKAYTFTLITDDGKSFDCVVAQDGRKAIHTTNDNSILGKYIRTRIGVAEGAFIHKSDLVSYGRTDFSIEKINDETFLLDLSI